ncbi:uncharacterized protein LOC144157895 [Haemaphysalis longicornis]
MDAKHKKAAVSPSTSSVARKQRNKKHSKMPAKDPGNDAGKKEAQAGAKVKTPNKKAAVSPSKYGGTRPPVAMAGSEKSRKKPSKNQKDAGETAVKAVSALELLRQAGTKTSTPDAGAVVSSSNTDVTSAQPPEGAEEKRRTKPSKHIPTTSDDTVKGSALELSGQAGTETSTPDAGAVASSSKADGTTAQSPVAANPNLRTKPSKPSPTTSNDVTKDSRPPENDTAEFPGESEDAQGQSSDGPGVQPAPTSAAPVRAQADAKDGDKPADLPAFRERDYITTILSIIGAVVLVVGVLVAVVVSLLVIVRPDTAMSPIQVSTTSGECVGKKVSVDGVDVYRWLGIPYAESTAGKNRFSKPRRITEKQRTMAQEPRLPCPQLVNGKVVGSEDCLHMNVWAPKGRSGAGSNRTLVLASVSYWFQRGSNNDPDWAELAAKANVVVMSPNVRLGVLGFLHPNNSTVKDVAKEDAKAAMEWAVANAAAFGARPYGVVLVGHGSGAYMLIEAATSLKISCSRAILEGPVPGALWPFNTGKLEPSRNLSTSIHCTGRGRNSIKLRCLRNSTLEVLLREAAKLEFRFAPTLGDLGQFSKGPALEIPEVIAGVDINQVRTFFDEYVRPLAVAARYVRTLDHLWIFTLRYFFPSYLDHNGKVEGLVYSMNTENKLLTALALYMGGCDTRSLVRKASVKGFHYITDGWKGQLFEPVLDMVAVVDFIKNGGVPMTEYGDPWEPWATSDTTRMEFEDETEAPPQEVVDKLCNPIKKQYSIYDRITL